MGSAGGFSHEVPRIVRVGYWVKLGMCWVLASLAFYSLVLS